MGPIISLINTQPYQPLIPIGGLFPINLIKLTDNTYSDRQLKQYQILMQKKSWFGGFLDKVKSAFTSDTSDPKDDAPIQAPPKKQYTEQQRQFIQEIFDTLTKQMKQVKDLSTDQQLALYGLYKQATVGNCNIAEPPFYEQQGRYKYRSWIKMKGLSQTEAQEIYIQAAHEFTPSLDNQSQSSLEKRGGQTFSNSVPRPKAEQEPEYDHPYFQKILNDEEIEIDKEMLLRMNSVPNILPLHFAIDNQKIVYVQQFLKHLSRQEANIPDGEGMTALEYAELIGNKQILELIRQAI